MSTTEQTVCEIEQESELIPAKPQYIIVKKPKRQAWQRVLLLFRIINMIVIWAALIALFVKLYILRGPIPM